MLGVDAMEKFNYYFNTKKRIDAALGVPVNKATIPSILFNLIWDVYYNISEDEQVIIAYVENWMNKICICKNYQELYQKDEGYAMEKYYGYCKNSKE